MTGTSDHVRWACEAVDAHARRTGACGVAQSERVTDLLVALRLLCLHDGIDFDELADTAGAISTLLAMEDDLGPEY